MPSPVVNCSLILFSVLFPFSLLTSLMSSLDPVLSVWYAKALARKLEKRML